VNWLPALHLLSAALFISSGRKAYDELVNESRAQLERCLNSRSCGLLEFRSRSADRAQFIHQTVKEFVCQGKGAEVIAENIDPKHFQTSHVLLLKYLFHLLPSFAIDYFLPYVVDFEFSQNKPVSQIITPEIKSL
jgi:hypothetical protein